MTVIELQDLWVDRGGRDVLCEINSTWDAGDVVLLAGPNGAGKTTLLSVLAGLCPVSRGGVAIRGDSPVSDAAKRAVGFLPAAPPLYDYLTVAEHLRLLGVLWGIRSAERDEEVTLRFGLADLLERPVAHLSLGQRQRVGLALVSFHDPPILLLDEPFNGLDHGSVAALSAEVARRSSAGGCVVVATHDLQVLDEVATRLLYLHEGRLLHDIRVHGAPVSEVARSIVVTSRAPHEGLS